MRLVRPEVVRDLFLFWTLISAAPARGAEAPPERARLLCDESDPVNRCPGADCFCVKDTLEVTFDGDSDSVFEYASFEEGTEIRTTIVMGTNGAGRQGWSFGVAHDESALELLEVGIKGTDYEEQFRGGFDTTSMDDIETCVVLDCRNRTPGGGWLCAVPLSFVPMGELPVKRNTLAWARYRLVRDVGEDGTLIRLTDRLAKSKSPPTNLSLTVAGKNRLWGTAVDGWVKKEGGGPWGLFRRGDIGIQGPGGTSPADGEWNITDAARIILILFDNGYSLLCEDAADVNDDGTVSLDDAVGILHWLFKPDSRRPPPVPFVFQGPDPTPDALGCDAGS